jgi:hypothetical protein
LVLPIRRPPSGSAARPDEELGDAREDVIDAVHSGRVRSS